MGFGRGILADARRQFLSWEPWIRPAFGTVVPDLADQNHARVIVPQRCSEFQFITPPDDGSPPWEVSPHELHPFSIVPVFEDTSPPQRTVLSDARDLLIETLYRKTYDPANPRSSLLECVVEWPGMWTDAEFIDRGYRDPAAPAKYIHIGKTSRVESLLRNDPTLQAAALAQGWDGSLQSLDGDGYVVATTGSDDHRNESHLIFVGGGDYGTYYAVAWFLSKFAGARWLFPGRLGTVIPRAPNLILDRAFYQIDEPDYRGRTLVGMFDGGGHQTQTPSEINDVRNWLLRNRLHPYSERAVLFGKRDTNGYTAATSPEHPSNARCQSLPPSKRKFLGIEARIPVGHGLSRFFSPNTMSFDRSLLMPFGDLSRVDALPDLYPDPTPRVYPDAPSPGSQPALAGQSFDAACGPVNAPVELPCTITPYCPCPREDDGTRLDLIPPAGCPPIDSLIVEGYQNRFARTVPTVEEGHNHERFIPRTTRYSHHQDSHPTEGWAPCIFRKPTRGTVGDENPLANFRETLAIDLANQLLFSHVLKYLLWPSLQPELCEMLGPDDGERFWCECIPCRSTNNLDGGGSSVVFKGTIVLQNRLLPDDWNPRVWLSQNPADLAAQQGLAFRLLQTGGETLRAALGLASLPTDSTSTEGRTFLDRAALQGLLPDRARLNEHTRRVVVLMNRTALWMHATARQNPRWFIQPEHTLLTFLTYLEFTSPPIFERDPIASPVQFYPTVTASDFDLTGGSARRSPDVLHPMLTPMISSSHDLFEYDDEWRHGRRYSTYRRADPFLQHRIAPEQFNHRRWSLIAQQTGIYEWMYGRSTIAPRIYTRRLRNALRGGYEDYRARVFLAETAPHMGLDGIKFYEVAQLLWDRTREPSDIRTEYCRALFNPEHYREGDPDATVVDYMQRCFDRLEDLWCDRDPPDRNPPEHRWVSGFNYGTHAGMGIMGRSGWITELDCFLRTPADVASGWVPPEREAPFFRSDGPWSALQDAYEASRGIVRERVQYFRRALGLIAVLLKVYHPVLTVWTRIDAYIDPLATDVLAWVREARDPIRQKLSVLPDPETFKEELAAAIRGSSWGTVDGFRTAIRDPIHQYIVENGTIPDLGEELGLGMGGVGASYTLGGRSTMRAFFNPIPAAAARVALFPPYLKEYVDWWNAYGVSPRRMTIPDAAESGLGVSMFASMKKLILTMMIATRRFRAGDIEDFERDA